MYVIYTNHHPIRFNSRWSGLTLKFPFLANNNNVVNVHKQDTIKVVHYKIDKVTMIKNAILDDAVVDIFNSFDYCDSWVILSLSFFDQNILLQFYFICILVHSIK